ncbi:SAC3/GANP/Nin1/mts3/eIF-3 p25 family-domain-containing protein, partial [Protomyces lactucae-debilis]
MCPQFEREQREYQNNVERWELDPLSGRIDPSRAIKAFHRPAAGNEQALPSDVRPPHVLVSTLDYLLDYILCGGDALELTHGFIRDRTRSIRQDFTLQNNRGPEAILCHERIARFHILSLHLMRAVTGFSEQQETEQLRKTLQSLAEYYIEQRQLGQCSPCEAEFRGYHILTRIRDPDVLRQVQTLPPEIRKSKHVQLALRLYSLAQRSNEELGRFKAPNCEGSQNLYARFFKLLGSCFTDYLSACLCETQFTEVRKGALKAMRKAFMPQQSGILVNDMAYTLGFDDAEEVQEFLEHFGVATTLDDNGLQRVELHKNVPFDETDVFTLQTMSKRIVEAKRNATPLNEIVRG